MKRFVSSKRFEAAAVAGALFLSLASGCAAEAPQQSPDKSSSLSLPISPELSLIAGSGGDWYTIEDGNLAAWGELHGGTDYKTASCGQQGLPATTSRAPETGGSMCSPMW